MGKFVPVQYEQHKEAGYSSLDNYLFAKDLMFVPVLRDEVAPVIGQMSLAFQKKQSAGKVSFDLVALQSLVPNKNLFILPDGRWMHGYRPAFYRSHPFALVPSKSEVDGKVVTQLTLSVNSDCIVSGPIESDARFFQGEGVLTQRLKDTVNFLGETLNSRILTINSCQELHEAGLIVPWPIQFSLPDGDGGLQKQTLEGLYHIDEAALLSLPAEKLAKLNESGALKLAYAQTLSEIRLKELAERLTAFKKVEGQLEERNRPIEAPDLDQLFGQKDDLLSF